MQRPGWPRVAACVATCRFESLENRRKKSSVSSWMATKHGTSGGSACASHVGRDRRPRADPLAGWILGWTDSTGLGRKVGPEIIGSRP